MVIGIRAITDSNKKVVLDLKIKEQQQGFIEPVNQCLAEAEEDTHFIPLALYESGGIIGFSVDSKFDDQIWLDRYLIDERSQGKKMKMAEKLWFIQTEDCKMHKQVIIIGAGLAGLSAAKKLKEQNIPFLILEATERVGGKINSITHANGHYFELGPQFFNDDMHAFNQLLTEANIPLAESALNEDMIEVDDHHKMDVAPIFQKLYSIEEINLSEDVSLQTFYEKSITNEQERRIIESYYCEILNIHPSHLSSIATIQNGKRYMSEQSDLLLQGAKPFKELTQYLTSLFQEELFTNHSVTAIHKMDDGYEVHTKKQAFYAQAVIIAVPPTIASQIQFSESLNTHFMPALQSYVDGAIIKITWLYPRKFWQDEQPLHGIIYTSVPGVSIVDSSKKMEDSRLTMFIGAEAAQEFANLDASTRLQKATALIECYFGKIVHSYTDVQENVWVNHPYCGGGYSAKVKFGGLIDAPEILRTPHGKAVFASSELALKFPNFMEGAIQAGYTAVDKLNLITLNEHF